MVFATIPLSFPWSIQLALTVLSMLILYSCSLSSPAFACVLHLVSILFGTSVPTTSHLSEMFLLLYKNKTKIWKDVTYGSAKYQGNVDGIYAVREEIMAYNNSTMGNHDVGRGLVL